MIIKSYEIKKQSSKINQYNLFLLYGENDGLKKEIKESIKKTISQDDLDTEFLTFHESDIIENEEIFYNTIYSGSLFSKKKIIHINTCTDKIFEKVKDIVEKYPENVFIIISASILDKKSKLRNYFEKETKTICIACYLDSDRDLESIAKIKLNENKIIISKESLNLLIEKSNSDRNNLKSEIDKIVSFSLNNKNLKIDEIKSIINFSGEHKSDNLINECLCGNLLQYKKILSELYNNTVNQIFFLRILSNKIQRLLKIKTIENNYKDLETLINNLKPAIFWKEKPILKKQIAIWSLDDLKKIVSQISDTEILCKENPQISKIIFFQLFTNICKKANSYSL